MEKTQEPAVGVEPVEPDIDWVAVTQMPQFQALRRRRSGFTAVVVGGIAGLFVALMALQAYAPGVAGTPVFGSVNLGFLLSMGFMLLCWVLGMIYSIYSKRVLSPMEDHVTRLIEGAGK